MREKNTATTSTEGITHLVTFVEENHSNSEYAKILVNQFIRGLPPANRQSENSDFFHQNYKNQGGDQSLAIAMQMIYERERLYSRQSYSEHRIPKGLPQDQHEKFAKESCLLKFALPYAYYGIGNCSHRSSYAGIHLAKILENSEITVRGYSFENRDQFVVLLTQGKTHDQVHFVYDPLTNPELVFDYKFYIKNILKPCFKEKSRGSRSLHFELIITPKHTNRLDEKIQLHHAEQVNFCKGSSPLDDRSFQLLLKNKCKNEDVCDLTKIALEKLHRRHDKPLKIEPLAQHTDQTKKTSNDNQATSLKTCKLFSTQPDEKPIVNRSDPSIFYVGNQPIVTSSELARIDEVYYPPDDRDLWAGIR